MSNINSTLKVLHNFFEGKVETYPKNWADFYIEFLLNPEEIHGGKFIKEEFKEFSNRELIRRIFTAANQYDLNFKSESLEIYFNIADMKDMIDYFEEQRIIKSENENPVVIDKGQCVSEEGTKLNIKILISE
jgi:hypothetical protein